MLQWFTNRRRKKILAAPFPREWKNILQQNVAHYCLLADDERAHLQELVQVFIAEKYWEGCGGLELTEEIRVTISAQACLLILNLPHNYYENVETIIVYPSTVILPQRKLAFFETAFQPIEPEIPVTGQAFRQGPLILVWDEVLRGSRHPESGYNVVYHEFAHKLDMLDGAADGTPPLQNRAEYRDWVRICSNEFLRLRREVEHGGKTFLNSYGAVNEAEFFAVATEQFFDQSQEMIRHAPDLYRVLSQYYRQDPARRTSRKDDAV